MFQYTHQLGYDLFTFTVSDKSLAHWGWFSNVFMVHGNVSHREVCEVSLGKLWVAQLRQYDEWLGADRLRSKAIVPKSRKAMGLGLCRMALLGAVMPQAGASGSQEAPLGEACEAQGGDMVAKQWQNLQLEWPSILASLKLETGNWKQLITTWTCLKMLDKAGWNRCGIGCEHVLL